MIRTERLTANIEGDFVVFLISDQYWRSMEQLLAYSKERDAAHLPA